MRKKKEEKVEKSEWEIKKEKEFEELYRRFFEYVYEYHVGYKEDFKINEESYSNKVNRQDFAELLDESGMIIKVCDGY